MLHKMGVEDDPPEPCTIAAQVLGCTCRLSAVRPNDIDTPEPRIDSGCPLHGSEPDPDAWRERLRDDKEWDQS